MGGAGGGAATAGGGAGAGGGAATDARLRSGRQQQPAFKLRSCCRGEVGSVGLTSPVALGSRSLPGGQTAHDAPPDGPRQSHSQVHRAQRHPDNALPRVPPAADSAVVGGGGGGAPQPERTRSASAATAVTTLPPVFSRCKSRSQPEFALSPTPSPSPRPPCLGGPRVASQERVRRLWRWVGERLGLGLGQWGAGPEPEGWAQGPGDVRRPVYARWGGRRHALAEPERMCMTQAVRERLEKDLESRRRSVTRRVSRFLTARLGLDVEEDLAV